MVPRYPPGMGSIEDYRRKVAELVALAGQAATPEDRAHLLATAAGWRDLILHTALVERLQRSETLDLIGETPRSPLG